MTRFNLVRGAIADLRLAWCSLSLLNRLAVAVLLVSGLGHVPLLLISEIAWDEPTSFRKPILFGLSTGLTLWSCLWVLCKLRPHRWDQAMGALLSGSLVVEVGLITAQAWRGTRSHFNRDGTLNAGIELLMLVLIVIATAIIVWICVRAFSPAEFPSKILSVELATDERLFAPSMRSSIRYGMLLLVVSCLLGFVITAIGKAAQQQGLPPELFGPRGVLKFPHGAALHAIQTLVVLAWFCQVIEQKRSRLCIASAIVAHFSWLVYALFQTFRGKARWEFDSISYLLLVLTLIATLVTVGMLTLTLLRSLSNRSAGDQVRASS